MLRVSFVGFGLGLGPRTIFNLDLPEGYSILINIQGQHGDLDNLSLKRVQDVYR